MSACTCSCFVGTLQVQTIRFRLSPCLPVQTSRLRLFPSFPVGCGFGAMVKASKEVLRQRHLRDKAAARAAKASLVATVKQRRRVLKTLLVRARKSKDLLEEAGSSDTEASSLNTSDLGADAEDEEEEQGDEDAAAAVQALPKEAGAVFPKPPPGPLPKEAGPPPKRAPPPPPKEGPPKKAPPPPKEVGRGPEAAPKRQPSARRFPNADGELYGGYPKGHELRCPACEQLLGGTRATASVGHRPQCPWRVRKVPSKAGAEPANAQED